MSTLGLAPGIPKLSRAVVRESSLFPARSAEVATGLLTHVQALAEACGASAVALALGALTNQVLYERWVVPVLPYVDYVPIHLWAIASAPGGVLVLGAAIATRSWGGLAAASVAGGLARHAMLTQFAEQGRPGHFKSSAIEDPGHWWTTHLLSSIVFATVCLVLARFFLRLVGLRRARVRGQ